MKVNPSNTLGTSKLGGSQSDVDGISSAASKERGKIEAQELNPSEPAAMDSAKVELSQRAGDMKRIKDIATRADAINHERVAQLQKLIDEGKYKTDSHAIADRLLDEHLKMPS